MIFKIGFFLIRKLNMLRQLCSGKFIILPHIASQLTMWSDEFPLILVYYRFRGQLQSIRTLFCYLELPYIEIQLDHLQEQKKMMSPAIMQHLAKLKIERSQLPVLIQGNQVIEGLFTIVGYTCKKYNKMNLFGSNIYIRSRVQEILHLFFIKQPQVMASFFSLADFAIVKSEDQTNIQARQLFQSTLKDSKFIRQICQYLDKNGNKEYIFGEITIIDFFFLEVCIYMNGIYSHPDRISNKPMKGWDPSQTHFLDKPNPYYLTIMQDYELRLKSQEWYRKHEAYLESFSIISSMLSQSRAKGIKKLWVGNPKLIA